MMMKFVVMVNVVPLDKLVAVGIPVANREHVALTTMEIIVVVVFSVV